MLLIYFIICAAIVVTFSIKLSDCADWFEKHTKMSGALVGFLLAATTSIPELVSGLTAIFIGQEEIAISSILGSNLFNYNIVAVANLAFISYLTFNNISKNSVKIVLFIASIYIVLISTFLIGITFNIPFISRAISLASPIIIIIYILSFKSLNEADDEDDEIISVSKQEVRKTLVKFLAFSAILIISSSILAVLVEKIVHQTGMKASLAGSVLLGASTSLPEFVGALSLMRLRQYDLAVSSVLSSNLFNFFVFAFLDIVAKDSFTSFFNNDIKNLVYLGFISTLIYLFTFKFYRSNRKFVYAIPSVTVLILYGAYLGFFQ